MENESGTLHRNVATQPELMDAKRQVQRTAATDDGAGATKFISANHFDTKSRNVKRTE